MHGTSHETWASRIGIWERISSGANRGEGRGEAFIQSGFIELTDAVLEEMFNFIEERFPEAGAEEANSVHRGGSVCLRIDPRFPRREEIALKRGFTRGNWSEPQAWLDAGRAPCAELPPGYRLASGRKVSFHDKALLHARSFGYVDKGSEAITASTKAFGRLVLAPDYRSELDLFALDDRGEPASMVGLWYDAVNGWGILEPVGTAREHCGRGLARALIGEGMKRLATIAREEGGRFRGLWVGSDQPFYLSIGFEVLNRWNTWNKVWQK